MPMSSAQWLPMCHLTHVGYFKVFLRDKGDYCRPLFSWIFTAEVWGNGNAYSDRNSRMEEKDRKASRFPAGPGIPYQVTHCAKVKRMLRVWAEYSGRSGQRGHAEWDLLKKMKVTANCKCVNVSYVVCIFYIHNKSKHILNLFLSTSISEKDHLEGVLLFFQVFQIRTAL